MITISVVVLRGQVLLICYFLFVTMCEVHWVWELSLKELKSGRCL